MNAPENTDLVNRGFRLLLKPLAPFVCQRLMEDHGPQWWQIAVLGKLYAEQLRGLPQNGDNESLINSLDIQRCLLLLDIYWNEHYRDAMPKEARSWIKELRSARNDVAHIGSEPLNATDTWRSMDSMARLAEIIDKTTSSQIRMLMRGIRDEEIKESEQSAQPHRQDKAAPQGIPNIAGLPSWREVMPPHHDIAEGRFQMAEFAADLAQVARGEGALEYRDPEEFFARTYVTNGMKGLLTEALLRVSRHGGQPVIQLKTAFGGGKTHSMLALYHLLKNRVQVEKIPGLANLLQDNGIMELPPVHVATLVGTAMDPSKGRRPKNLPGATVNTMWGELAYQLATSAGKPELYELVAEADKRGVSPGSEKLKQLFDGAGACLVLMDELVAYARKLDGGTKLPAGNFENFLTFIQELTEAARASQASLVVASIPESAIEIGNDAGQRALAVIEHTFGRMESVWKPVAAHEGFEVVRRRLFRECTNPAARNMICKAFSDLYNNNPADFPAEARDLAYLERMKACYPIHPEVFDRLYEDWATLEHFQRTRGVLRLLAAVIHELWMRNDPGMLIQPGSLPLDAPTARDELIRRLKDNWNAIVDKEVDGKNSEPFLQDRGNARYGQIQACRRVARTIMLGSAPTVREQMVRGLESSRIRLGVVQPGEQVAIFNDALAVLRNRLAYLYSNPSNSRYWFDTRPTLLKTMEDRAGQIPDGDVEEEILQRMRKFPKKTPPFAGVHLCPASSLDVPDEQTARLVLLPSNATWRDGEENCPALARAADILEHRGNAPRSCRNMLLFLAADSGELKKLEQAVRQYLAWLSIRNDSEELNLDAIQNRETENSMNRASEMVNIKLEDCWVHLLSPTRGKEGQTAPAWETGRISGKQDNIILRAARKAAQDELVIDNWAPALLLMELDNLLWRGTDWLPVKKLWEYLCAYCYLPRLTDFSVLEDCIRRGVESGEYFAYAAAIGEDRFIDLKLAEPCRIDKSGFIIRLAPALAQKEAEAAARATKQAGESGASPTHSDNGNTPANTSGTTDNTPDQTPEANPHEEIWPKRFFLSTRLDNTRVNRDVARIIDEVLSHISHEGSMEIRLEVQAVSPAGFSGQTMRIVSENCRSLRIDDFGFEPD